MDIFQKTLIVLTDTSVALMAESWHFEGSAGVWSAGSTGVATGTTDTILGGELTATDYFGDHSSMANTYVNLVIKHPSAILPDVRLEYANVKSNGKVYGEVKQPPLNTVSPVIGAESELTMAQFDTILFYNLVENMLWSSIDLGLDLKYIASEYKVDSVFVDESFSSVLPLLYLRGRVDAPFAPMGLEADIKYITDGESIVYDLRVKVDYSMDFIPILQPGLELGYRLQKFKAESEDSEITFDGLYGGVTVKF